MRFAKTFFAAFAITLATAWAVKPIPAAETAASAYCNGDGSRCILVLSPDGTYEW